MSSHFEVYGMQMAILSLSFDDIHLLIYTAFHKLVNTYNIAPSLCTPKAGVSERLCVESTALVPNDRIAVISRSRTESDHRSTVSCISLIESPSIESNIRTAKLGCYSAEYQAPFGSHVKT